MAWNPNIGGEGVERIRIPVDQPHLIRALKTMQSKNIQVDKKVLDTIKEGRFFDRDINDKLYAQFNMQRLYPVDMQQEVNHVLINSATGYNILHNTSGTKEYYNIDDIIDFGDQEKTPSAPAAQPQEQVHETRRSRIGNFIKNLFGRK